MTIGFPLRAYYVSSGEIRAKIMARTGFEAAKLVFERFSDGKVCDPYFVNVGWHGFDHADEGKYSTDLILRAAGYTH